MEKLDIIVTKDSFAICSQVSRDGAMNWQNSLVSLISSSQHQCPIPDCQMKVQLRNLQRHVTTYHGKKAAICYRCPVSGCDYAEGSDTYFTKLCHCVTHYLRLHPNGELKPGLETPAFFKHLCDICSAKFRTRDALRLHFSRKHKDDNCKRQNINSTAQSKELCAIAPKPDSHLKRNIDCSRPTSSSQICFVLLDSSSIVRNPLTFTKGSAEIAIQTENLCNDAIIGGPTIATSPMRMVSVGMMAAPHSLHGISDSDNFLSPLFVEAETFTDQAAVHSTAAQTVAGVDFVDPSKSPQITDLAVMSVQTDALDYYRWSTEYMSHAETQTMALSDDDELFGMGNGSVEFVSSNAFQNAGTQTSAPFAISMQPRTENRQDLFSLWP